MFKIGEFSKLTQVSVRMLRYYDEIGLVKPAAVDNFTNYRLYSASQITVLGKIKFLRDLGFNTSEISAALTEWGSSNITGILNKKQTEIQQAIKVEQDKLAKIELAKKDILNGQININYNVSIKPTPSYNVISLRKVMPDYFTEGLLWEELSSFVHINKIDVTNNNFAIYHDLDYREKDVDIEICAEVLQMGEGKGGFAYRATEPQLNMAYTMVYGPFENISGAFYSFANWLSGHSQYKMSGPNRQIVHRGPWNENNPFNYLTEIQIPLEKI
ncbi:MAG: MerR family transcriptional regulator [Clostridiales bacterium]|nr:MerR family transcriptional regulator [Clostridiales bacterium]